MLLGKVLIRKINKVVNFTWPKPGLSIIEVILVIAILSLTVFVINSLFPFGLRQGKTAEQTTIATNLAQSKIEELIGLPYDDLTVGTSSEPSLLTIDQDFSSFSRTSVIYYLDSNLIVTGQDNDLKKIKVMVNWFNPNKQATSTVTLSTITSKK